MADYLALIAQRADLDKQIAAVRKEAVKTAWKEIKKVMKTYNLSKEELFKLLKPVRVVKNPVGAKYKINDTLWSGRGIMPRAFLVALQLHPEMTIEDFRISK